MLGNIIAAESIQHDVVIFLPPDSCSLDKWPAVIDVNRHILGFFEEEKFLRNTDYGLIDFNDINPGVGKQISEGQRDRAASQADHQNALRAIIEQQTRKTHAGVVKHEPLLVID